MSSLTLNANEPVEQAILGAIFADPHCWDAVSDKLAANNFQITEHRKIFVAMKSLSKRNLGIDIFTVDAELRDLNLWDDKECLAYLGQLATHNAGSANISSYITYIVKNGTILNLRQVAGEILKITEENLEPSEMIDKSDALILEIESSVVRGGGPEPIRNIMQELIDSLEFDREPPLSTGFHELDLIMDGGMRGGELNVIAGRPGQGKTTLGINIATHVATTLDKGVLIFSMEMTPRSLVERMFLSMAQVNFKAVRGKPLTDFDATKIANVAAKLKNNRIRIDGTPRLTPSEIRARARRDMREYKDLSLIVVDYVQMMKSDTRYDVRANEIGECSGALKALAKELNIPIIALAQLNRNSVTKGIDIREPNMADLKDSGSIEQDADLVALIHREDTYKEETAMRGLAKIIIDKQRNGSTGSFILLFDGPNNRFLNYKGYLP